MNIWVGWHGLIARALFELEIHAEYIEEPLYSVGYAVHEIGSRMLQGIILSYEDWKPLRSPVSKLHWDDLYESQPVQFTVRFTLTILAWIGQQTATICSHWQWDKRSLPKVNAIWALLPQKKAKNRLKRGSRSLPLVKGNRSLPLRQTLMISHRRVVAVQGLEPRTLRIWVACSTTWATPP